MSRFSSKAPSKPSRNRSGAPTRGSYSRPAPSRPQRARQEAQPSATPKRVLSTNSNYSSRPNTRPTPHPTDKRGIPLKRTPSSPRSTTPRTHGERPQSPQKGLGARTEYPTRPNMHPSRPLRKGDSAPTRPFSLSPRGRTPAKRPYVASTHVPQEVLNVTPEYPMRLNKYLAHRGYATRKKADEYINAGKVFVNGSPALLGSKVLETDDVKVLFKTPRSKHTYLAYNKPRGTVTHGAQEGEVEIMDHIKKRDKTLEVFPVGRLDKNSHGLIILTNDGRIVHPLLSPDLPHEKEYKVTVNERLRSDFAEKMSAGVDIGDYITKPCVVERRTNSTFRIILTEGKNHQIKRMTSALGYTVHDLQRIRVMNIRLARLPPNTYRHIKGNELELFLKQLGITHTLSEMNTTTLTEEPKASPTTSHTESPTPLKQHKHQDRKRNK